MTKTNLLTEGRAYFVFWFQRERVHDGRKGTEAEAGGRRKRPFDYTFHLHTGNRKGQGYKLSKPALGNILPLARTTF